MTTILLGGESAVVITRGGMNAREALLERAQLSHRRGIKHEPPWQTTRTVATQTHAGYIERLPLKKQHDTLDEHGRYWPAAIGLTAWLFLHLWRRR